MAQLTILSPVVSCRRGSAPPAPARPRTASWWTDTRCRVGPDGGAARPPLVRCPDSTATDPAACWLGRSVPAHFSVQGGASSPTTSRFCANSMSSKRCPAPSRAAPTAGAKTQLVTTLGEGVQGRGFAGNKTRRPVRRGQHVRSDVHRLGAGCRHRAGDRRRHGVRSVRDQRCLVALVFQPTGQLCPLGRCLWLAGDNAEPEEVVRHLSHSANDVTTVTAGMSRITGQYERSLSSDDPPSR